MLRRNKMESFESNNILFPEVTKSILEMVEKDQEARRKSIEEEQEFDINIDRNNTEELKKIIEKIGWPTVSKVGKKASNGAWLLVQHADQDVHFQKYCLEMMKKEPVEEVSEVDIAYLHDRVCVNEGKPQFFGTQFYDNEYGAYGPRPIEDEEHVDERRKALGLDSLSEYKTRLENKYKAPKDK